MNKKSRKQRKNLLILFFYVLLLGVLSFKVLHTVFQGSILITQHKEIKKLEKEGLALSAKKIQLEKNLSEQTALLKVKNGSDLATYIAITQVYTITDNNQLAQK